MPTVLITGANRGLGLEFARQYAADGWQVHACARKPGGAHTEISGDVVPHVLDVTDGAGIAALAKALGDEALDILINNAGVYGGQQQLGRIDPQSWDEVLRVNAIAPIMVSQALLPSLKRAEAAKIAIITSRMGSIADNTSGGTYAYRSSKAALNAAGRSLALDLKDAGICVLLLHPGWVRTDMGGPGGNLEPPYSISALRQLIAEADMSQTGGFFAHDGSKIGW